MKKQKQNFESSAIVTIANSKNWKHLMPSVLTAALTLLVSQECGAIQIANEYWISPTAATANLGTLEEPFDGSTAGNFDLHMGALAPNSVMHILPGTYQTLGSRAYLLRSGTRIIGSGIDITTIKLVGGSQVSDTILGVLLAAGPPALNSNMVVCDLTVDADADNNGNNTLYGVGLYGTKLSICRVKAINCASKSISNLESFPLGINRGAQPVSVGNLIEDCEVSQFRGVYYCSALAFGGCSGTIRNNRIFLNTNDVFAQIGINGADLSDLLVEGNYLNGGSFGFYGDTGNLTNVVVSHNSFLNCLRGITPSGVGTLRKDLTLAFNNIELADLGSYSTYGVLLPAGVLITNVAIFGNNIKYNSSGTGAADYGIYVDGAVGVTVAHNSVDQQLMNIITNSSNATVLNNFDTSGRFLTNINQIEAANGIVRKTVTSNTTITYADKYLGCKNTATITLTLPSAVGHAGKDFIFVDETGTASGSKKIVISAAAGQSINGTSTKSIGSPYGVIRITSDGTNWFQY